MTANRRGAFIVAALTLFTLGGYALAKPSQSPSRGHHRPPDATALSAKPAMAVTEPVLVKAATGDVTLTAQLDRTALLERSDGEVHVALKLLAAQQEGDAPARKPIDTLVVLDISGSMSGQKLDYAKQALHQLVDRLSTSDRFSLVTYESEAALPLPLQLATGSAVARFHAVVDRLQTAGGTNMSAGLDLALSELQRHQQAGREARVLLLSDGHANEGDSSHHGLAERARRFTRQDDVLSAMGIGDDFNEDLMTALADQGTGNFYYLSKVDQLARYFDAELRAAAQTVASALELRFEAGSGVELVELGGYPIEKRGEVSVVRPGNLVAGQERQLWATLRAPTGKLGDVALGSFSLRFKKSEETFETEPQPLPLLACVADQQRFEQSIARGLWEEYISTEQYQKSQAALGRAIGEGTEADIVREQRAYESNRALAEKLGSARVLNQLAAMAASAEQAKKEQSSSGSERNYHAKHRKSRALFDRRGDAYSEDPLWGL